MNVQIFPYTIHMEGGGQNGKYISLELKLFAAVDTGQHWPYSSSQQHLRNLYIKDIKILLGRTVEYC